MLKAVQLYSVYKNIEEEGLEKVLSAISKTGYDGVEFAGFYNYSPDQIQEFLKKYNLKIVGIHAGI